jgi:hypothetical protein
LSKPVDLASIRAYRGYGKRLPGLKGVELARWRERLDYEAGLTRCRLAPIELPEQASAIAHRMADGCRLLVGLRDDRWNTEEFTLARNFSKAWCALTDAEAQAARAELESYRVLRRVGHQRLGQPTKFILGSLLTPAPEKTMLDVADLIAAFDATEEPPCPS